jgi:purine-nucleoside phosphorylase
MLAPASPSESVATAAEFLRRKLASSPAAQARIAIVLGSGLGGFVRQLEQRVAFAYREIPYFPSASAPGHEGKLVAGVFRGTPVIVLQGRVHGYEGYSAAQVAFPVRTLAALGVRAVILTNAAGGIRLDMHTGQLVLISDHINLTGQNPAAGLPQAPTEKEAMWNRAAAPGQDHSVDFGPRFFDMGDAYSKRLREVAHAAAGEVGQTLAEGVYIGVPGPSFETPAEIRAFRSWGADLVGMSTVVETIAARQLGLEVLGISCVTNMAAGIESKPLDHLDVMETGRAVEEQVATLLGSMVPRMAGGLAGGIPDEAFQGSAQ